MRKSGERSKEDTDYAAFVQQPKQDEKSRSEVLKPGKVKPIHIDDRAKQFMGVEWDNILNKPCLYTCDEVDALLASFALSSLSDVCVSSPGRHDFLMYDEENDCWKNYGLSQDFEDIDPSQITDFHTLSMAFIRIEDALTGVPDLEDA